jgi:hydroxymethylpyrimidine pyrophosphatase-like HAD family hydrolase
MSLAPAQPLDPSGEPAVTAAGLADGTWLEADLSFYQSYPWCLNPCPTVRQAVAHLRGELGRLGGVPEGWQAAEVRTNVFLLACTLLNSADDYLRGPAYRLPRRAAALPLARVALWAVERATATLRARAVRRVRRWRDGWQAALDAFLQVFVAEGPPDPAALAGAGAGLTALLEVPLPRGLLAEHTQIPSAFRKQDLTHFDVLALGRKLVAHFPDRGRPVLVVGIRTAGSYFAPLLRAFLKGQGYRIVDAVTVRPNKGAGPRERAELARCGRAGYLAAVVDDPPGSGDTLGLAVDLTRAAGFTADRLAVLFPVHRRRRDWTDQPEAVSVAGLTVLTLGPEEWHKQRLLELEAAEGPLTDYFRRRGYGGARVVASPEADRLSAGLEDLAEESRRTRLKRVCEVRLETAAGGEETCYVLAKSVGWGWLGYHAFVIGRRLAGLVTPVLGLRDGILYTEWLTPAPMGEDADRERWVRAAAGYVAARARALRLGEGDFARFGRSPQHEGFAVFSRVLSRAYGGVAAAGLMRPRVLRHLADQPGPPPTLIDGRMRPAEWVAGPAGLLKADFEHHGLGKNELNVTDPAYDLADATLHLGLSPDEEARLVRLYAEQSGDADVAGRLFRHKLLAGVWAMDAALRGLLYQPHLTHRQQDFHRQFVSAWHFLTVQAARFCGGLCGAPAAPRWGSPLVVLDVDGVLDRRLFGFPCTSAAGVRALALLHAHGWPVAIDTARSAAEVKEYCRAYGLVGAVAEYGSYVWDAVAARARVVVGPEALGQLERARQALGRLPGVFLDERYVYSVRACTYEEGGPGPLPTLAVQQVMAGEGLDRLRFLQTTVDTTVVAREVDKGKGLLALLDLAGRANAETVAVGDTEPDLAMFRAATRGFAPAHTSCARLARSLGCRIAGLPYQRGLLEIVRSLVHADGGRCEQCARCRGRLAEGPDLFVDLLEAADRGGRSALLRALLDPLALQVFVR